LREGPEESYTEFGQVGGVGDGQGARKKEGEIRMIKKMAKKKLSRLLFQSPPAEISRKGGSKKD